MLNELGVTISVEEVVETFTGHTFTLEFASKRLGTSLPHEFLENYRDRTFAAMEAELKPVQGVEIALDQITIPYCIASNGPHEKMRKTLGVTSLLSRFEGRLFSSADVERGKPFPDLFLFVARHFTGSCSSSKTAQAGQLRCCGFWNHGRATALALGPKSSAKCRICLSLVAVTPLSNIERPLIASTIGWVGLWRKI